MRIKIDEDRCVGCGLCEENLPFLVEMGRHYAVPKLDEVPDEYVDAVIEAIGDCPAGALSLQEHRDPLSKA